MADEIYDGEANKDKKKVALEKLNNAKFGRSHIQAVLVAGSGFFCDSYDNFVIGLIVPMLAYGNYRIPALDPIADGWLKAASSYGNMFGQFFFAILGDILGRKKMYGVELIILITGAIGCAVGSWEIGPFSLVLILGIWRFILGVGVGGDYPVSAVITSEFASSKNRGRMIAVVFAMQGLGIITGAIVSVIVLWAFKDAIISDYSALNYCWRVIAGFGAIPALLAVYFRLTIPETPRYAMDVLNDVDKGAEATDVFLDGGRSASEVAVLDEQTKDKRKSAFEAYKYAFSTHFSKWVNLKVLLGCALTWFFLDIGYYGTSLNTTTVLGFIGYGTPRDNYTNENEKVFDEIWFRAIGNVIINLAGTVPGYWFTVAFVEWWGRKPIQYMGFILLTIIFIFMGLFFNQITDPEGDLVWLFITLYAAAQFFFNFGPNTTTFIIPAEAFPTTVRSTGHGISAASGKLGAILAAQGFSAIAESSIGIPGALFIFAGCCFLGTVFTYWVPETKGKTLEEIVEEGESLLKKGAQPRVADYKRV